MPSRLRLRSRKSAGPRPFVIDSSSDQSDGDDNTQLSKKTSGNPPSNGFVRETSPSKRRRLDSPGRSVPGPKGLEHVAKRKSANNTTGHTSAFETPSSDQDSMGLDDFTPLAHRKLIGFADFVHSLGPNRRPSSGSDLTECETDVTDEVKVATGIERDGCASLTSTEEDQKSRIVGWRVRGRFLEYQLQSNENEAEPGCWTRADTLPKNPWDMKIKLYFHNNPTQRQKFARTVGHVSGSGLIESNYSIRVFGAECSDRRTLIFKVRHELSSIGEEYAEMRGPELLDQWKEPVAQYWRERIYDVRHENTMAMFAKIDIRSKQRMEPQTAVNLIEDDIGGNVMERDDEIAKGEKKQDDEVEKSVEQKDDKTAKGAEKQDDKAAKSEEKQNDGIGKAAEKQDDVEKRTKTPVVERALYI